jgi:hypothetical protein
MAPSEEQLRKLLSTIFDNHAEHDMDCESCNQQFECLAEMVADGAQLVEIIPAVENHLCCCPDCREEFEALVAIVRAENSGYLNAPDSNMD